MNLQFVHGLKSMFQLPEKYITLLQGLLFVRFKASCLLQQLQGAEGIIVSDLRMLSSMEQLQKLYRKFYVSNATIPRFYLQVCIAPLLGRTLYSPLQPLYLVYLGQPQELLVYERRNALYKRLPQIQITRNRPCLY